MYHNKKELHLLSEITSTYLWVIQVLIMLYNYHKLMVWNEPFQSNKMWILLYYYYLYSCICYKRMWRLVSVNQWNATEYRQEYQHLANIIHTCIKSNFILIAHRLACSNTINVGECFYSSAWDKNMTCYNTWMSSMAYISHGTTGFRCESNKGYMNERNKQYEGVWLEEGGVFHVLASSPPPPSARLGAPTPGPVQPAPSGCPCHHPRTVT